ncbi:hypothetical protein AGRA3207_003953 [Actinomadura graeca]|uniref:Uncharacterized protein n=1 Tax=Actinomadura graeca TaxID=2750812 RepID=A0ABX8QVS9_9ACTN|nr:hypothetical protein [Actinomadura graeca]QXJ22880.1 hypothetical protein AGRA3207_003953 [Actinomadura graeca]
MRHRAPLLLGSLTAMAALTLTSPAPAQAATGVFTYRTQPGNIPHALRNPVDSTCYVAPGGSNASNDTNRDATLYASNTCTGAPIKTLQPGQHDDSTRFGSVKFVR